MKTIERLNRVDRSRLGARARMQRERLGLTRNAVAAEIGTSPLNLLNWEKMISNKQDNDHLWEQALNVPSGWLRDQSETITATETFSLPENSNDRTFIDDMRSVFCWYARQNPARRTCDFSMLTPREVRSVEIMLQRYGIFGEEHATLQIIGDRQGLTRERVRQISEIAIARFGDKSVSTSVLERLRTAIESHLPCKITDLDIAVRDILGGNLSIEGAERFAREVLGCSIVRLTSGSGALTFPQERMAISSSAPEDMIVRTVRQVALAMVRTAGAAQVFFVAGASAAVLGHGVMPDEVVESCRMFGNFEWLVEVDGWFWFGPGSENRAKTCAMKVLSVADRNVDIEEIYGAMSRARIHRYDQNKARLYMINAPISVLQEVLARIPEITRLQYNDFRLNERIKSDPLSVDAYLSETEIAIRNVITSHGGVASRSTLVSELVDSGAMVLVTLNMALDGSPVVRRLDSGVWTLAGTKLSLTALRESKTQQLNAILIDGWWEFEVAIPKSAFERGDWFVPMAAAAFLTPGEYAVEGHSEPAAFVHTKKGNPTLRRIVRKLSPIGIEKGLNICFGINASERRLRFQDSSTNKDIL